MCSVWSQFLLAVSFSGNEMGLFQANFHSTPLIRWGFLSKPVLSFSMLGPHTGVGPPGRCYHVAPAVDSAAKAHSNGPSADGL